MLPAELGVPCLERAAGDGKGVLPEAEGWPKAPEPYLQTPELRGNVVHCSWLYLGATDLEATADIGPPKL